MMVVSNGNQARKHQLMAEYLWLVAIRKSYCARSSQRRLLKEADDARVVTRARD